VFVALIAPLSTSLNAPVACGLKNSERRQSYVSVVIDETTALSPGYQPNLVSAPRIATMTPAGTPYSFSNNAKKAALEAFFFRPWEIIVAEMRTRMNFSSVYLNDF